MDTYPSHTRAIMRNALLEVILLCAVCMLLYNIAAPLGHQAALYGLHERYPVLAPPLDGPISWRWLLDYGATLWQALLRGTLPVDTLAVLAARHAGAALIGIAATGWLSLQLIRLGVRPVIAIGLWLPLAYLFGLGKTPLLCIAAIALLSNAVGARHLQAVDTQSPCPHPLQAFLWPIFVLLVGIQWLTIVDFAARGPLVHGGMQLTPPSFGARYFGLWQLHALVYASVAMCAVAACRDSIQRGWIALCTRVESLIETGSGQCAALVLVASAAIFLGWVGFNKHQNYLHIPGLHGLGKPQLTGEILKMLAAWTLAWFAYRVSEWPTSQGRLWLAAKGALCIVLLSAGGLVLSDDSGPILVLALAVPLLVGLPILNRLESSLGKALACALITIAWVAIWHFLLMEVAPAFKYLALQRKGMALDPFTGYRPTLAFAHWLMDAIPGGHFGFGGFGLGAVPYCGARPLLGLTACTLGTGAPIQMPSDMGYALLYVSFGPMGALLVAMALAAWCAGLAMAALPQAGLRTQANTQYALLGTWMVAVPAIVTIAQLLVSVGALMGWSSLTGITMPLGYGSAALLGTALWVGLAVQSKR